MIDIKSRSSLRKKVRSMKETSAKRETPPGTPGPAPNMGAWDSQTLPYDPRGQHASARGKPGATGAKVHGLGAPGAYEAPHRARNQS